MSNVTSGKGLAALLGDIAKTAQEISQGRYSDEKALDITLVKPNQQQPRTYFDDTKLNDLVDSIKKNGVLQPIVVRSITNSDSFEIIAGERRYRACLKAGFSKIPAIVITCSDTQALEIGLIENLQRDDLNPIEEAEAYLRLTHDHHKTQDEIAKAVSKSRSYIANQIRLTTLPDRIKDLVRDKKITAGHARTLINNPDANQMVDHIIANGLNVRETENFARQKTNRRGRSSQPPALNEDALALSQKLQDSSGMRVKIMTHATGGTVTFYFDSYDQLDTLIHKLD